MNTGEILIRLLKFGLILYLALAADQVLYREGTTRERPWIRLMVYVLVGLVSFLFFHSITLLPIGDWGKAAAIVAIALFIRVGFYILFELLPRRRDQELLRYTEDLLKENYDRLAQSQLEQAKQIHDFKNHLNVLASLTEKDTSAQAYIRQLQEVFRSKNRNIQSGNRIIDAIVSHEMAVAEEQNIDFSAEIHLTDDLSLSDTEICVVLANLLDNAIEACLLLPSEDRRIRLEIGQNNGFTFFKVINSAAVNPFGENGELIRLKKTAGHGLGVRNIRETLTRHGGTLVQDYQEHTFTSTAMF
ncbi:MAG: GHKL domain-containing protein [Firmicutes bacterium]|nr:GHKL domain-containing protein [Bacillota bacterium]